MGQSGSTTMSGFGGVIEPRGPLCAGLLARGLRHHAQLNDWLIGRGSFLVFGRSFSGN